MNMSFSLGARQVRLGQKDVTRRLGWKNLKPGQRFWAIEKGQGLKKGQHVKRICECECVSNTPEPLDEIIQRSYRGVGQRPGIAGLTHSEAWREGFWGLGAAGFVVLFCKHMRVNPRTIVNRIEFRRI